MPRKRPAARMNTKRTLIPRPQLLDILLPDAAPEPPPYRSGVMITECGVFQHLRRLFGTNLAMLAHFFIAAAGGTIGAGSPRRSR